MIYIRKLWRDCNGATAVEYGLMIGLIALVFVAGATLAGSKISAALMKITAMN